MNQCHSALINNNLASDVLYSAVYRGEKKSSIYCNTMVYADSRPVFLFPAGQSSEMSLSNADLQDTTAVVYSL